MAAPDSINTLLNIVLIVIVLAIGVWLLIARKKIKRLTLSNQDNGPNSVSVSDSVLGSLPNAIIYCSHNGTIEFFNNEADSLYGNRLTIGDNIYNYLLLRLPNPEELDVKQAVDLIDEIDFSEMNHPKYHGTETFSYSIRLVDSKIAISVTNISKAKIIENKMANLYSETRAIIDSSPSAMELFSADGSFIYANNAFNKLFGIGVQRPFSQNQKIWDNPAYKESFKAKIRLGEEGEANVKVDFANPAVKEYYCSSNSEAKYFNVFFRKIYNNKNSQPNILVVSNDISLLERRNREAQGTIEIFKLIHSCNIIRLWGLNLGDKTVGVINEAGLKAVISADEFFSQFIPQDIIPLKDAIQRIGEGRTDNATIVVRTKDETVPDGLHYWNVAMHPVIRDGKVAEVRGCNVRVTYQNLYTKLKETRTPAATKTIASNSTLIYYDVATNEFTIPAFNRKDNLDNYMKSINPMDIKANMELITGLKSGKSLSAAISYRFKTISKWHTMLLSISPKEKDENGKVKVYEGAVTSNLKWDQLVNSAEESDKLLKSIINNTPCMITIKDPDDDFRYLVANNIFCSTLDADKDLVLRHTDYEIFGHSPVTETIYKEDAKTLENGSVSFDVDLFRNGAKLSLHIRKVLFRNAKGQNFVITSALNLTKLNSTIAQLKEAKNNAEKSDKLKSAFLANMSHEIRTPLNAICGFSELLIKAPTEDKRASYSKLINVNTDYLLKLISDILDISKIEAGYVNFNYGKFDMAKLFADMHEYFSKRKQQGVDLILDSPYPYCMVNSDIRRIKQIISNYVSNSLKYTKQGYVKMGYRFKDNGIYISVEDTGCGISENDRPRIFGRFEKLNPYVQGTGLGLALCKAISESAGGYVGFQSEAGKGSIFWAWLPCEVTISDTEIVSFEESDNSPSGSTNNNGKHILVAEDDDSNYSLLYVMLKDCYKVDRAIDGQDAIKMASAKDYAAIFMDIKMPVIDGLEATRTIRKQGITAPIIAITAYAFQTDKDSALEAGCDEFLPKPINIKKLKLLMMKYGLQVRT